MEIKKIAKYMAVFVTMFALSAVIPAYAPKSSPLPMPFAKAYAAQINATGTLTLKNFTSGNPSSLIINTSFTSLVPSIIIPGEYDAEFHGFAAIPKDQVRLDGVMIVNGINFWVAFAVDRPSTPYVGGYSANGTLHLIISAFTLPPQKITMVEMKGDFTKLGDVNVSGSLEANAKIGTHNVTDVHGSFTLQPPPTVGESDGKGPGNFTRSFYIITLVNATNTQLNYGNSALYVEGFWNVYNRTVTVTHIDHEEETTTTNTKILLANVTGNFNVTLTPQASPENEDDKRPKLRTLGNFTLNIPDLKDMIEGDVIFYQTKFADPGDRDIPKCDFNQDHVVNILDVNQVAKAFGAKYGDSRYDPNLDLDGKLAIDIYDLVRVAQEFGREY